jgi:hypothetical protein
MFRPYIAIIRCLSLCETVVLYCMSQLHVASYLYCLIKIKNVLLNLIKPVNFNLLMGPISAIFGHVGMFVFHVVSWVLM